MSEAQPTTNYARPNQIEEMKAERDVLRKTIQTHQFEDTSRMDRQLAKIESEMEAKTPPDLTGPQLDLVVRREAKLRKEMVDFGMPSHEEMRKNPPGVVGRNMRWEAFIKASSPEYQRGRMHQWKQDRRVLHKGDEDPDQSNFDVYRPTASYGNLENAQIPGQKFFGTKPSPEYRANYDETFGKEQTEDELRQELSDMRDELARLTAHDAAAAGDPGSMITRECKCGKVYVKKTARGADAAVRSHERQADCCKAIKE